MTPTDPRDSIAKGDKEWQEFRATFAGHLLHAWLLDELPQLSPGYFESLEERFSYGFDNAELLARDDPSYDGAIPVDDPDRLGTTFYDPEFARLHYDQLFPHGKPEGDFAYLAWGAVVTGLHSALEVYARSKGARLQRTPLPVAASRLLSQNGVQPLDAPTADALTDLDETRHLLVHHRGIVTERYLHAVKYATFRRQELRPINRKVVFGMAQAVWLVASRLRGLPEPPGDAE